MKNNKDGIERAISVCTDWIEECKDVDSTEDLYKSVQGSQEQLILSLYTVCDDRARCPDMFNNVVKHSFFFARSKDERLRDFALLFAPTLIYIYLSSVSIGEKKTMVNVGIWLLALYNMELFDEQGNPKGSSFRLPTLARNSLYHEPDSLGKVAVNAESIQRFEAGDAAAVKWGPPRRMDTITAANRLQLATALVSVFNSKIGHLPHASLTQICKVTSKLVSQGFTKPGHHQRSSYGSDNSFGVYPRPTPRICVTSELLTELLHSVYFAMYNDAAVLGLQAIEDIHLRAQYELYANVLLMSNAVKNSINGPSCGQTSDSPMGINVALTPSASASPLSKSFITNASFRTKKLPEDIPIQRNETTAENSTKTLGSISEETDDKNIKTKSTSHVSRDSKDKKTQGNLSVLVKKKDKEKNRNGDRKDEKKTDKKLRDSKHDSNRGSWGPFSSDTDVESNSSKQSPQPTDFNNVELKFFIKSPSSVDGQSRIDKSEDGEAELKYEANGSQNHVSKIK